jgi:hypothetical protein
MSNVFVVENTAGTLSLTIKPGSINGPGGYQQDTDLRLYGMGALLWGEGVDTNILRLAENFACPDKGALGSPVTVTGVPQDESDLGPGKGITYPVEGQMWFNTTSKQLYVYDSTLPGWKVAGAAVQSTTEVPPNPQSGDLWYDIGSVDNCGNPILKIYDPSHPAADGTGFVHVTADSVSQCGDYMAGELDMGGDDGGATTRYKVINVGDPTNPYDAVNLDYLDTQIAAITGPGGTLSVHMASEDVHLTADQNTLLDAIEAEGCANGAANSALLAADLCDLIGYSNSFGTIYTDIDGRLPKSGGTMTGNLTLNGPGHTNTGALAATEDYVDAQVATVADVGNAVRFPRFFNSSAATGALDGDILVETGIVYVRQGGAWRQIFPAVYT